jgi:hypothetical protein
VQITTLCALLDLLTHTHCRLKMEDGSRPRIEWVGRKPKTIDVSCQLAGEEEAGIFHQVIADRLWEVQMDALVL